jgi:hypothetical protein
MIIEMTKLLPNGSLLLFVCFWLGSKPMARGQAGNASFRLLYQETSDAQGIAGNSYPAGWTAGPFAGSGTAGQA